MEWRTRNRCARCAFDPGVDRTYCYWHVFVPRIRPGQLYAYWVEGPCDPSTGMRFYPTMLLLDPYGRAIVAVVGDDL